MKTGESFYYQNIFKDKDEIKLSTDVEPSAEQKEDTITWGDRLVHRMLICAFAIGLLWITTLANCVYVVNLYIPTPTFSAVTSRCSEFFTVIEENDNAYKQCVRNQLAVCENNLETAYSQEMIRVSDHIQNNADFSDLFLISAQNCSQTVSNLKSLLTSWLALNSNNSIPYRDSCQGELKNSMLQWIGDQTVNVQLINSQSDSFIDSSNSRLSSLVDYSTALNQYNYEYISNKTKSLHFSILNLISIKQIQLSQFLLEENLSIFNQTHLLLSCLTITNSNISQTYPCPYKNTMNSIYSIAYLLATNQERRILSAYRQFQSTLQIYQQDINDAETSMTSFYNSINGAQGIINYLLKNSLIPSSNFLCGKSNPNFCNFDSSNWYIPTLSFDIEALLNYPLPSSLGKVADALQPIVTDEETKLLNEVQSMIDKVASVFQEIPLSLDGLSWSLDDYHPPRYHQNLSDLLSDQVHSSKKFQQELYKILYQNNSIKSAGSTILNALNQTEITSDTTNGILSKFHLMWTNFHFGQIHLDGILSSLLTIQGLLFFFDYLYRIILSVQLFSKYWKSGIISLPTISLLKSSSLSSSFCDVQFLVCNRIMTYFRYFLILLPYLWMQFFIVIIFLIFLVAIISALIVPEYHSYMRTCVWHSQNETFLSSLSTGAAMNYASLGGNKDYSLGIGLYNSRLTGMCNTDHLQKIKNFVLGNAAASSGTSAQSYADYLKDLRTNNQSFSISMNHWNGVNDCIDLEEMVILLQSYCTTTTIASSLSSQQFCSEYLPVLSSLLSSPSKFNETCPSSHLLHEKKPVNATRSKSTSFPFLVDDDSPAMNPIYFSSPHHNQSTAAVMYGNLNGQTRPSDFRCDHLPTCVITCTGPDPILIHNAAKDCSCMMEWFLNGYLIQLSFAILIFLLANLSRIFVCDGILRIFWRELTSPVFECQVYCDEKGQLLLPDDATPTSSSNTRDPVIWRICCFSRPEEDQEVSYDHNGKDIEKSQGVTPGDDGDYRVGRGQEKFIAESIRAKMTGFVRIGYAYLLLAVLLNIAWIYCLQKISASIEYDPSLSDVPL